MRKLIAATVSIGAMLFATSALAQEPGAEAAEPVAAEGGGGAPSGTFELGLRAGYGIPLGEAAKDADLNKSIKGMIPIWLDVGYRINPNIYVGVYFQYGLGLMADDPCTAAKAAGVDCSTSGSNMRFGAMGAYHFMPEETFDVWAGVGLGYEIQSGKADIAGVESKGNYKGFEFINLQVGGDYKISPNFGVGPFLAFTVGQYSSQTVSVPATPISPASEISGSIDNKGIHQWLILGIRGVYDL